MKLSDPIIAHLDSRGRHLWLSSVADGVQMEDVVGTHMWDWGHRQRQVSIFNRVWMDGETVKWQLQLNLEGTLRSYVCTSFHVDVGDVAVTTLAQELPCNFKMLTKVETNVLRLLANGHSTTEVSKQLDVHASTINTHLHHIRSRLNCTDKSLLFHQARLWFAAESEPSANGES